MTAKRNFTLLALGISAGQQVVGHVITIEVITQGVGRLRRGVGIFVVGRFGRDFFRIFFRNFSVAAFFQGSVFKKLILNAFLQFRHWQLQQANHHELLRSERLRLCKLL